MQHWGKDRIPVFCSDELNLIAFKALHEARKSGGFLIFSYVLMPDYLHAVTNEFRAPADTLRFIKGIVSRRVIDHLKKHGYEKSLLKLQHEERGRKYRYSLWQNHSNVMLLTSESTFMQRVNYTHQNPVRAGIVERAQDYKRDLYQLTSDASVQIGVKG